MNNNGETFLSRGSYPMETMALRELIKECMSEVLAEKHPCLFSEEERVGIKETIKWMKRTEEDRFLISSLKLSLDSFNHRLSNLERWKWTVTGGGLAVGFLFGMIVEYFKR
jgi:hypothetical protein